MKYYTILFNISQGKMVTNYVYNNENIFVIIFTFLFVNKYILVVY